MKSLGYVCSLKPNSTSLKWRGGVNFGKQQQQQRTLQSFTFPNKNH